MKKIKSLFKRNYEDPNRLVYDELVEGSEWVAKGEGWATRKWDGTCCKVEGGILWKRYDRKKRKGKYKPAPNGWVAAQAPDPVTGHWPGWVPVGDGPEDQWHREALENHLERTGKVPRDGTYELCGPRVQGNPENLLFHWLIPHGMAVYREDVPDKVPRTFNELKEWFKGKPIEGIVWWNERGDMVKIKKRDFGLERED